MPFAKPCLMSHNTSRKQIHAYFTEVAINLQVNQSIQQTQMASYSRIFIHELNCGSKTQYNYWEEMVKLYSPVSCNAAIYYEFFTRRSERVHNKLSGTNMHQ